MGRYRREARLGWIQILCIFCNSGKGRRTLPLGLYIPTDRELIQEEDRDPIDLPEYDLVAQDPNDPF